MHYVSSMEIYNYEFLKRFYSFIEKNFEAYSEEEIIGFITIDRYNSYQLDRSLIEKVISKFIKPLMNEIRELS